MAMNLTQVVDYPVWDQPESLQYYLAQTYYQENSSYLQEEIHTKEFSASINLINLRS